MRLITYLRLNAISILNKVRAVVFAITALAAYVFPFALMYETVMTNGVNVFIVVLLILLSGLWTLVFIYIITAPIKIFK